MPSISDAQVKAKIIIESDTKGVDEAERKIGGFSEKTVRNSQQIAAGLFGAGVALGGLGIKAIQTFGQVEQSQIAFTTLLGDAGKATALVKQIQEDAAATPFEFQPLIDMNQKLIGAGLSAEVARTTVLGLGDALSASGSGAAEMSRIGNTMSQVFGKGKADAIDFKEMVNAGWVSVRTDTADAMGVTMAQFGELVSSGKVDFAVLQGALAKVTGEGGKFNDAMARQSQSVMGLWSTLKDTMNIALADVGKQLFETFNISEVLKTATEAIAGFSEFLSGNLIPFLKENSGLIPIIAGTILALLVPAVVALGIAIFTALSPVTLIILGIGLAVAALYLIWNNNFLGIKDIVAGVWDFLMNNVFAPMKIAFEVIQFALKLLWNAFVLAWELGIKPMLAFFGKWFNDTFGKQIQAVFTFVKGGLDAMKKGWDDIMGGIKSKTEGVASSIISTIKNMVNSVIGFFNGLIDGANKVGAKVPGYITLPKIPSFAEGVTNFRGGTALVGERGPELVTLPKGSNVIPNDKLGKGTGEINVTQNIYNGTDVDFAFRELAFVLKTA